MIIGIGMDLVDIARVARLVEKRAFVERVFVTSEIALAESRVAAGAAAATFAKRFAAKEAFVKALQTNEDGISWTDMEVVNVGAGAPEMRVSGPALDVLMQKMPPQHRPVIHLSLTDTDTTAGAYVVIEAHPDEALA